MKMINKATSLMVCFLLISMMIPAGIVAENNTSGDFFSSSFLANAESGLHLNDFDASIFWSLETTTNAFWSLENFNADVFWSLGITPDAFWSMFLDTNAFWSMDVDTNAFWSMGIDPNAFWSMDFDINAFWSMASEADFSADAFWSVAFWTMAFWSMGYDPAAFWSLAFWSLAFWSMGYDPVAFWSMVFWSMDFDPAVFWSMGFDPAVFWSLAYWSVVFIAINGPMALSSDGSYDANAFWSMAYWSVAFWSMPFWSVPFWSMPFWSVPFWSMPFWSMPYWSVPFWSMPFWSMPFWSMPFWSMPFWSMPYWSVPFWSMPFWSMPYWSMFNTLEDLKGKGELHPRDLGRANGELRKGMGQIMREYTKGMQEMRSYLRENAGSPDFEMTWNINAVFDGNYVGHEYTADVNIAILDTGIDINHPDLSNNIAWTIDVTGGNFAQDESGHGTHIAGIVGAEHNGFGVIGVYPNANLYSIKVIDPETMSGEWGWAIDGIYQAIAGPDGIIGTDDDADVISMSFDSQMVEPPQEFYDAIKFAYDRGVVLVAAAGNAGDDDHSTIEGPTWPASYDEVIAVGATDMTGEVAFYSSTLNELEVVAPGSPIYSTFLDGTYAVWGGTSMATPHVAGIVALIIAHYGKLPVGTFDDFGYDTIRGILHSMAIDFTGDGWDPASGYGFATFRP
jgi:hypothetical protein